MYSQGVLIRQIKEIIVTSELEDSVTNLSLCIEVQSPSRRSNISPQTCHVILRSTLILIYNFKPEKFVNKYRDTSQISAAPRGTPILHSCTTIWEGDNINMKSIWFSKQGGKIFRCTSPAQELETNGVWIWIWNRSARKSNLSRREHARRCICPATGHQIGAAADAQMHFRCFFPRISRAVKARLTRHTYQRHERCHETCSTTRAEKDNLKSLDVFTVHNTTQR
jgi:hypothetical protein